MADIKQAAKWMQEGNRVHRSCSPKPATFALWASSIKMGREGSLVDADRNVAITLYVDSLLAEDWEIAE